VRADDPAESTPDSGAAGTAGSSAAGGSIAGSGGDDAGGAGSSASGSTGADGDGAAGAGQGDAGPGAHDGGALCGLRITELKAVDANSDGGVAGGDSIVVQATVENDGPADASVVVQFAADDPIAMPEGAADVHVASIVPGGRQVVAVSFQIAKKPSFSGEIGFSATASLATDPTCVSPAIEPYVVTTDPGYVAGICKALRQIVLTDPKVTGIGGPIAPGADIRLSVVMTNPGPLSLLTYPGLNVTTDSPSVTLKVPAVIAAFELAAMRSLMASATLHVDASLPHGTLVHIEASAAAGPRCRNVPTLDVPVLIP
jgi:hypothetical protein